MFSLLILLVILSLKEIIKVFSKISTKTWVILLVIFSISLFLRIWIAPHTHYVYYDEFEYLIQAKNLAENHLFEPLVSTLIGGPFLYSFIFLIFGFGENVIFNFNAILGALSTIVIFLLVYLITDKEKVGILTAVLLGLLPLHIKFSGSGVLEISSLFFIILCFLFLFLLIKTKKIRMALLSIFTLGVTSLIRIENILLVPLFVLTLILFLALPYFKKRGLISTLTSLKKNTWLKVSGIILLILLSTSLSIIYLPYLTRIHQEWRQEWLLENLSSYHFFFSNLKFWLTNPAIPIVFMVLVFAGFLFSLAKFKKILFIFGTYFILFFGTYTFYQKLNLSVSQQRFNLILCFPLLIFAGLSMEGIKTLLNFQKRKHLYFSLLVFPILILACWNFKSNLEYIEKPLEPTHNQEYEFLLKNKKYINKDCLIFSHNIAVTSMIFGNKTIHPRKLLENKKILSDTSNNRGCLLFFKSWWCYHNKRAARECKDIEEKYKLSPLLEARMDQNVEGFYKILGVR